MDRKALANLMEEMAVLLELSGANPFKARAFQNAARTLLQAGLNDEELQNEERLRELRGVGASLAEAISEAARTGHLKALEELKASLPEGLLQMVRLPGLGAKRVRQLYEQLGISTLGELAYACNENRLLSLPGFGPKIQAKIMDGLEFLKRSQDLFLLPDVFAVARELEAHFADRPEALEIVLTGDLRRSLETTDRVVLTISTQAPGAILTHFSTWVKGMELSRPEANRAAVRHPSGPWAEIVVVPPESFATALVWTTGSQEHLDELEKVARQKGFKLRGDGLFKENKSLELHTEAELYGALGLDFIPPELREGQGEIAAASEGRLPKLVEAADIKGTFHVHTNASDGGYSLMEMARAVKEAGLNYLCLSDHSRSAFYAGGLSAEDLAAQAKEVAEVNEKLKPFRVFHGVESDILTDGALDYPDEVLARLDLVIASIHSNFGLDEARQTERIIRAVSHPAATILGHPTGRLLLSRRPYPLDIAAVIESCAAHGVAMEINAHPSRLDTDWRVMRQAREKGVKAVISPDAHSLSGLDDLTYGLGVARKAWLEPKDLLNCLDTGELTAYLKARKEGG